MVGIKSLFNLAVISGAVSPVFQIRNAIKTCMILLRKTISTIKLYSLLVAKVGGKEAYQYTVSSIMFNSTR
jgi:hypothetical protein